MVGQPELFDSHRNNQMTLDEYIKLLMELREQMPGDTPVQKWLPAKGRHHAPPPKMTFAKTYKLPHGERRVPVGQFWHEGFDLADERGYRVVRV